MWMDTVAAAVAAVVAYRWSVVWSDVGHWRCVVNVGYRNGFLISEDGMKEGRKLEVDCECGLQKWFWDLRRRNEGRKEGSFIV